MDHPACRDHRLEFRLADPDRRLAGVRLDQHAGLPADQLAFAYDGHSGAWRLDLARPALWRLEYRLELHHPDGRTELICDPGNPLRAPGAFGDRSVLECPDYHPLAWLGKPPRPGRWRELTAPAPAIRADVAVRIWSPATPTGRILLAHDGPEYDRLAALGHYSAAADVPPHHLVLLAPGNRNEWYSANPAYSWALVADILPRVYAAINATGPAEKPDAGASGSLVGMGASLGGLAMLHAQRRFPAAFAGLFLQSGSFFLPRFDRHESGFQRYLRIVRFVGRVTRDPGPVVPVPTVLTCGLVEENRHNNREMASTLARQGYPVTLFEVPDAHNFVAWRDAFDPALTALLKDVWGPDA
jgi:enterochelin esterase-like enzyme